MKRNIIHSLIVLLVLVTSVAAFSSCGSVASASYGMQDESYLIVTASKQYLGETVFVSIDGDSTVQAVPIKEKHAVRKGKRIVVSPGKHTVVVTDRAGVRLYEKQIFVSTNNGKMIHLP
ncbi:hypothetical protein [Porphyromonas gulae]|uniref:hypothetical protein n=1 Tax=Porphyromonas gulae TaxID=111105 RepID=UPI0026EC6BA9|nr:hypothetical protein [Porphyromonas gulae]